MRAEEAGSVEGGVYFEMEYGGMRCDDIKEMGVLDGRVEGPGRETELLEVCTLTDGEPLAPKMPTALLLASSSNVISAQNES